MRQRHTLHEVSLILKPMCDHHCASDAEHVFPDVVATILLQMQAWKNAIIMRTK